MRNIKGKGIGELNIKETPPLFAPPSSQNISRSQAPSLRHNHFIKDNNEDDDGFPENSPTYANNFRRMMDPLATNDNNLVTQDKANNVNNNRPKFNPPSTQGNTVAMNSNQQKIEPPCTNTNAISINNTHEKASQLSTNDKADDTIDEVPFTNDSQQSISPGSRKVTQSRIGTGRRYMNDDVPVYGGSSVYNNTSYNGLEKNYSDDSPRPVVLGYNTRYVGESTRRNNVYYGLPSSFQDYNDKDDEEGSEIFVQRGNQTLSTPKARHFRVTKPMSAPVRRFSRADLIPQKEEPTPLRHPTRRPDVSNFTPCAHGRTTVREQVELRPSRHSGVRNEWDTHNPPEFTDADDLPSAFFEKRDIDRPATGSGTKVAKRANGPNDPENIEIVNLFDVERKSWSKIADILNDKRIADGRVPSLTPNGCVLRYNRTAPLFYKSRGQEFIPLKYRKKGAKPGEAFQIKDRFLVDWTPEKDSALISTVREYETQKWETVAQLLNREFVVNIFTAKNVAARYPVL